MKKYGGEEGEFKLGEGNKCCGCFGRWEGLAECRYNARLSMAYSYPVRLCYIKHPWRTQLYASTRASGTMCDSADNHQRRTATCMPRLWKVSEAYKSVVRHG
jgi:hypothetical protein